MESGPLSCRAGVACACVRVRFPRLPLAPGKRLELIVWKWEGASCAFGLLEGNRVKVRGAASALGLPLLPPHLSSRPPQVALATFEPSLFVKVILFGLSRLGRFPGTAKPKAKSEQGTGSRYGGGSSAVWFFYRWDLSSPPLFQVFLDFSAVSTAAFPGFGLSRRGAALVLSWFLLLIWRVVLCVIGVTSGLDSLRFCFRPCVAPPDPPFVSAKLFLQGLCADRRFGSYYPDTGCVSGARASCERGHGGFRRVLKPSNLDKKGVQPGEAQRGIRTFLGGQDLRQRVRRR